MRNWFWQARYWTYSMMYGPNHLMPPYNLNHTSGSGSVGRFWGPLSTWLKMNPLFRFQDRIHWRIDQLAETLILKSSRRYESLARRYRHIGSHRGSGRQTRTQIRSSRRLTAQENDKHRMFQELMGDSTEPIQHVPGSRAYRRLAWSRLNHEATRLRSRFYPEDEYEQVP